MLTLALASRPAGGARGESGDGDGAAEIKLRWMEPTSRGTIPAFGRLKWRRRNGCGDVPRCSRRPRQISVYPFHHRRGRCWAPSTLPSFLSFPFCFFGSPLLELMTPRNASGHVRVRNEAEIQPKELLKFQFSMILRAGRLRLRRPCGNLPFLFKPAF